MRYFLFLLLASTTLFSQDAPTSSDKYVWAESGLVLRAEGNSKGKKLAVIPYGAKVQLTGAWGDDLSVEVIQEGTVDNKKIPGWNMHGRYIGVTYAGQEGYAFSGYINGYDPQGFSIDTLTGMPGYDGIIIDTLHFQHPPPNGEFGELSLLYSNGIIVSNDWNKDGGGGTIVVPNADLATGFHLAGRLFYLNNFDTYKYSHIPYLVASTRDSLSFRTGITNVTIKECFGMVIIRHDSYC